MMPISKEHAKCIADLICDKLSEAGIIWVKRYSSTLKTTGERRIKLWYIPGLQESFYSKSFDSYFDDRTIRWEFRLADKKRNVYFPSLVFFLPLKKSLKKSVKRG